MLLSTDGLPECIVRDYNEEVEGDGVTLARMSNSSLSQSRVTPFAHVPAYMVPIARSS